MVRVRSVCHSRVAIGSTSCSRQEVYIVGAHSVKFSPQCCWLSVGSTSRPSSVIRFLPAECTCASALRNSPQMTKKMAPSTTRLSTTMTPMSGSTSIAARLDDVVVVDALTDDVVELCAYCTMTSCVPRCFRLAASWCVEQTKNRSGSACAKRLSGAVAKRPNKHWW